MTTLQSVPAQVGDVVPVPVGDIFQAASACRAFGSPVSVWLDVANLNDLCAMRDYLNRHGAVCGNRDMFSPTARSVIDSVCQTEDPRVYQGVTDLTEFYLRDLCTSRPAVYSDFLLSVVGRGLRVLPSITGIRSAIALCCRGDAPLPEGGIVLGMTPVSCVGDELVLHVYRERGLLMIGTLSTKTLLACPNLSFMSFVFAPPVSVR